MRYESYEALAAFYDLLQTDADYPALARFYKEAFRRFGRGETKSVVDLGCGTGKLLALLAQDGYDLTGIDASEQMLSRAQARTASLPDVLLLQQDMTRLDLFDVADAMLSSFDCLNYLPSPAALSRCFDRVALFLRDDGLFLFDVNTEYKFRHIFANETYVLQNDDIFCTWENVFVPSSGICHFYLTLFSRNADETWSRSDEYQRERMFTDRVLRTRLQKSGFSVLATFADPEFTAPCETDPRRFYVCRRLPRDVAALQTDTKTESV